MEVACLLPKIFMHFSSVPESSILAKIPILNADFQGQQASQIGILVQDFLHSLVPRKANKRRRNKEY